MYNKIQVVDCKSQKYWISIKQIGLIYKWLRYKLKKKLYKNTNKYNL